jgi:hypothetical protein
MSLLESAIVTAVVALPLAVIVVAIPMFVRKRKQY